MSKQRDLEVSEERPERSISLKEGMSDEGRDFLYPEEVDRLIQSAKKQGRNPARDALMILMAYRHGLRVSELVGLKWNDIDWKTGRIFVRRSKGSNDSYHPLYPDETRGLKVIQKEVKQMEIKRGYPLPFIFNSEQGRQMDVSSFRKLLYKLSEGWEFRVHPHMLRHACGFYLINQGRDVRVIQDYLGHRNIQNTTRYTKLSSKQFEGLWEV